MAAERVASAVGVRAYAKINLTLRVVGARPDGYHDLHTTFQSIALHDTLTFRVRTGPFHITCDEPACPAGEANLVWRAAQRVWTSGGHRGAPQGVAVRIAKRIPMEAGLGGGSSDAAAAIRALAALWHLDLTAGRTRRIAAALGADVPFFLEGGTALGVGRGDVLSPLPDPPAAWVTLVIPAFGVRTAEAYEWWDTERLRLRQQASAPARSVRPFDDAQGRPELAEGRGVSERLPNANDLEDPVAARYPEIARLVKALRREGAASAGMSGSGSAVFGVFERRADAAAAADALARRGRRVIVTRTLDRARYARLARPRRA
jgi:4-diphosphocytidyl-2-C-methyl-D-erythritol kinase